MAATTSEQLSSERLDCVHRAVAGIFGAVIGEEPVYQPDAVSEEIFTCDGVLGVISLVGQLEWSLVISMSETSAPLLVERFAGFPVEFGSSDMGDAVGELANLLGGEVKVELDHIGVKANISLPQVFRGRCIEILRLPGAPTKVLVYNTTSGPILVAIAAGR